MQTMVAEMVKKPEHEPTAYALQPVAWAVGSVAGSALGGFTAQPARWYPGLFSQDGIFAEYPYLLPNLVSVVVIVLAMIQGIFLLEETNPAILAQRAEAKQEQDNTNDTHVPNGDFRHQLHKHAEPRLDPMTPVVEIDENTALLGAHSNQNDDSHRRHETMRHASLRHHGSIQGSLRQGSVRSSRNALPDFGSIRGSRDRRASILSTSTYRSGGMPYISVHAPIPIDPSFDLRRGSIVSIGSFSTLRKGLSMSQIVDANAIADDDEFDETGPGAAAFTKQVWLWVVALWLLCYHQMAWAALLPIYLLDDPQTTGNQLDLLGGLGKTLPQVGTILAVNSIISLLAQAIVFPIFVARVGVWWSGIILIVLSPLVYFLPPFLEVLPDPMWGVYGVMTFQALTSTMAYPVILILLKNACPTPLVLGRVNGLAMSGCSAARTIAPPVVGALYGAAGSAGGWWSASVIAIIGVIELAFISRPRDSSETIMTNDEIVRRASISTEVHDYYDD